MSEIERTVEWCVSHITSNAAHYFDIVRRSGSKGILWMVLTADSLTEPIVKRVSFLPMETVAHTQAPSLMKMVQACVVETQFVVWFTVEGPDESPITSKVMIVEAMATDPSPMKSQSSQIPYQLGQQISSVNQSTEQIQKEIETFRAQRDDVDRMLRNRMKELEALHGNSESQDDPWKRRALQQKQGMGYSPGSSPARASPEEISSGYVDLLPGPVQPQVQPQSYQQKDGPSMESYNRVLRVSMEVADAASRMGRALDDLTIRVTTLQKESQTQGDMLTDVIRRIDNIEKNQVYQQQIMQYTAPQQPPHPQSSLPHKQLHVFHEPQEKDSNHVRKPLNHNNNNNNNNNFNNHRDGFHTPIEVNLQVPKGGSSPKAGSGLGLGKQENLNASIASGGSSYSKKEGSENGSLSDMIRTMEEKLSKIKVPTTNN